MSGAPSWVSYAALLLSGGSLGVAALSFRAGDPRLRIETARWSAGQGPLPDSPSVQLTVINSGRAAATVASFWVTPYGNRKPVAALTTLDGPALPFRVDPHASQAWTIDLLEAAHAYDDRIRAGLRPYSSWPARFRLSVTAGDSRNSRSRVTFDSLRIIADSAPERP